MVDVIQEDRHLFVCLTVTKSIVMPYVGIASPFHEKIQYSFALRQRKSTSEGEGRTRICLACPDDLHLQDKQFRIDLVLKQGNSEKMKLVQRTRG